MSVIKKLRDLHIAELHARQNAIALYEKQVYEFSHQANVAWYTWTCLEHGWEYCLGHGISLDSPTDLSAYHELVLLYKKEYHALQEKQALASRTVEALHEALSLFLAENYSYDISEHWELDLDQQRLIQRG